MKKYICDIIDCDEEAWHLDIDACFSYTTKIEDRNGVVKYEPFEKPYVRKYDLCEKHFREWCKATYEVITQTRRD